MPHLLGKGSACFGAASIISWQACTLTAFLKVLMVEVNTDGRQTVGLNTGAQLLPSFFVELELLTSLYCKQ